MPRPIDSLIARMPLRHGEELRVTLSSYRGQQYLHLRKYYDDDGRWKPGKGLALRIDLLPWMLSTLQQAERSSIEAGLLELEDWTDHDLEPPADVQLTRPT